MAANSSTSSFRRILLRFLLPCTVALALLFLVTDLVLTKYLVLANESSGAYKIERLFHGEIQDEIPIYGSSRAAGAYVPELIHPQAFNYGIEKTQYDLITIMLGEELKKDKTLPIIINFDLEFFETWYGDQAHFIPHQDIPEIRKYSSRKYKLYYEVPAARYFGVWDSYLRSYLGERSGIDHISKGGWFLRRETPKAELARKVEKRLSTISEWIEPPTKAANWLAQLASTDRKIVVVMAPYHPSYYSSYRNIEDADAYMEKMNELPNVRVLDYGKMQLDNSHFKNTTHVNYAGATLFSHALQEAITDLLPEN